MMALVLSLRTTSRYFSKNIFLRQILHVRKHLNIRRNVGNYQRPSLNRLNGAGLKVLRQHLDRKDKISIDEWKNLRSLIIANEKNVNEMNVDAAILLNFELNTELDFAKDYVLFLRQEGIEPNYATIGRLMKMYYASYRNGSLTAADCEEILRISDRVMEKHTVLDAEMCENLIHGLVTTKKWPECVNLLKMAKQTCTPSASAYSITIAKCFHNSNDNELGWQLLKEMVSAERQPKCDVFIDYFAGISNKPLEEFTTSLEMMLEFIGKNEIQISKAVVNELIECLHKFEIASSKTVISPDGICKACRNHLCDIVLSDEEFKALSSTFLEKVLIRKDIFQKTDPDELQRFTQLLDKKAPFDYVIDGLNVAFSTGVNKKPIVFAKLVSSIVDHFAQRNKKILVVGRKHMNAWPKVQLNYIKKAASIFLANNLSHDDPFLLYAAIKSGKNTDFFSRDLMRSHAFLLGPDIKSIFRRWQQIHQHSLITTTDYGKVIIKGPTKFNLNAHKIQNVWHIPFREEYSSNPGISFKIPENWLCFKWNKR